MERRVAFQLSLTLFLFDIVQAGTQNTHCPQFVLRLRSLILTSHHHPGRDMDQTHSGWVLLHVLSSRARGTVHFNLDIALRDLNINVFRFSQNGNRNRRGMDSPRRIP